MFKNDETAELNAQEKMKAIEKNGTELGPEEDVLSTYDLHQFFSDIKHKEILVVEDDLTQTDLIEEMLLDINSNAEIEWETDADRAWARITASEFAPDAKGYDLIICDVVLEGGRNGVDLMNYCREINSRAKVILISAHPKSNLKNIHFKNKAPVKYLKKPLNYGLFYNSVAPILEAS